MTKTRLVWRYCPNCAGEVRAYPLRQGQRYNICFYCLHETDPPRPGAQAKADAAEKVIEERAQEEDTP